MPLLLPTTLASRLEACSRSSYFTSDQITAKGPEKSGQDSQGLRICHHVEDLDEAPGSGLRNESVSSESSLVNPSVVGEHKINTQKWPCFCTQELNKTSEKEINEFYGTSIVAQYIKPSLAALVPTCVKVQVPVLLHFQLSSLLVHAGTSEDNSSP